MSQRNTYNVYGRFEREVGSAPIPLWLYVNKRWPSGASIPVSPGDYIPAGTPVIVDKIGGTAKIFVDGSDDEEDVTGLTWNDVYVDQSMKDPVATVAIVIDGEVLSDRLPVTVTPALIDVMRKTTQIVFANES